MKQLLNVPAPAKLNIFLHVTGRRPDGYHLLHSLFVLIDWADTLHFERRNDGQLRRHDLNTPLPDYDLCLQAAQLLQEQSSCAWGVDISINKQLPSGAGMGGGSSDAATTLLALNRLWDLNWPKNRLLSLALQLGADVPFFVGGDNAIVTGIGEQLSPLQVPAMRYAVIKPETSVETRSIFTSPDLMRDDLPAPILIEGQSELILSCLDIEQLLLASHNSLQPVAEVLCPEITQVVSWLQHQWGNARMTGSGSAVFAIETTEKSKIDSKKGLSCAYNHSLTDLPSGWLGKICQGLPSHPLKNWAS